MSKIYFYIFEEPFSDNSFSTANRQPPTTLTHPPVLSCDTPLSTTPHSLKETMTRTIRLQGIH